MSTKPVSKKPDELSNLSISSLLGVVKVLPGESEEIYQSGLIATIAELGAVTPLQIYLAEKIFECLWWMRRYEEQKRATLISEMIRQLDSTEILSGGRMSALAMRWAGAMFANRVDKELTSALSRRNETLESLRQRAFAFKRDHLIKLDEQVALKAKTLVGFQASYEVLVNRKLNVERMQLSNDLLRRDLGALDLEALPHDQPQKTPGQ